MAAALSRFRMLDLSRQLPGPFCSMLLADLGMDVLAVYAPTDPMGMGIPLLGRNKRSLTLNLKTPEGREIFTRLAREADVVLEGSRPGAAARRGIDYPRLSEVNPRLVYCSISGYGQDGPYRDRVGHDINYLGFAGVIGLTGTAGGPPAIPGVQIADIGGGALMAAVGILAALWAREETGRGQLVDIAMMDGSVAWQVVHVFRYLLERDEPARGDTLLTGRYPTRVGVPRVLFPTSTDGLPDSEMTLAAMLKARGYKTMCVGKWHLGHLPQYLPTRRGFDEYFGIPYSNDMRPRPLLHGTPEKTEQLEEPARLETLTPRYTEQALRFIERSGQADRKWRGGA